MDRRFQLWQGRIGILLVMFAFALACKPRRESSQLSSSPATSEIPSFADATMAERQGFLYDLFIDGSPQFTGIFEWINLIRDRSADSALRDEDLSALAQAVEQQSLLEATSQKGNEFRDPLVAIRDRIESGIEPGPWFVDPSLAVHLSYLRQQNALQRGQPLTHVEKHEISLSYARARAPVTNQWQPGQSSRNSAEWLAERRYRATYQYLEDEKTPQPSRQPEAFDRWRSRVSDQLNLVQNRLLMEAMRAVQASAPNAMLGQTPIADISRVTIAKGQGETAPLRSDLAQSLKNILVGIRKILATQHRHKDQPRQQKLRKIS